MLNINFDTSGGNNTVYIGPKVSILQTILISIIIIPSAFILFLLFITFIILSSSLGNWLGSFINNYAGLVLSIIFIIPSIYYGFIYLIISVAYLNYKVSTKINFGYMKNGYFMDKDNRVLECYSMQGILINKIDLNIYSTLVSNKVDDSERIRLYLKSNDGDMLDLTSIFTKDFHDISAWSTAPDNNRVSKYPTDEIFSLWNGIKLVRDNGEVPLEKYRIQTLNF